MKVNPLRIRRERLSELVIFLVLLISYVYFFPRWADQNQNSRLDMIVAVVDDGTLQIDRYVENTVDYARVGDHYYSDKAPGTAFLGIPIYAGLKWLLQNPALIPWMDRLANNAAFQSTLRVGGSGIYIEKVRFAIAQVVLTDLISAVPAAFLGVLLLRVLRKLLSGARIVSNSLLVLAVLGYGLLTPAFPYAGAFYGHQLTAAILFGIFYLIFKHQEDGRLSPLSLVWIGFLLALSVIVEYPTVLIAGVLGVYLAILLVRNQRITQISWTVMGGIVPILVWMAYNNAVFGGPLNLGYNYSEQWQTQHHTGFMSLTFPHMTAVWGLTFGVFRGLLFYSPVLILGLVSLVAWWKNGRFRLEMWVSAVCVGLTFLFNASSSMWWGGWAVGPRYLVPALPFLVIPVAFGLERWWHLGWLRVAAILLAIWSFAAIWGLTLAGQSFPSDVIANPLLEYALPNWISGNIARNLGTIFGLSGALSLIPLALAIVVVLVGWSVTGLNSGKGTLLEKQNVPIEA